MLKKIFQKLKVLSAPRFLVRRLKQPFILSQIPKKKISVIVDIGVGKAPYKKHFKGSRYIGVDIEDRGGVPDLLIEDINNGLSLEENVADLIICTEVLEHTKKPHIVVKELYRITKPGGTVLLTSPMVWPVHEAPNDFFRYTNFGLEYLFKDAGFREVKVIPSNGYCYTMCALSVLHMKQHVFRPITLLVNIIGVMVWRLEKNTDLSLGHHVVAVK